MQMGCTLQTESGLIFFVTARDHGLYGADFLSPTRTPDANAGYLLAADYKMRDPHPQVILES